jgi:uncharacterized phage protein (TIGR02220 family)
MARMSIDDMFLRDTRVAELGALLGWNVYEARGRLLDLFAVCYDRKTALLLPRTVNAAGNDDRLAHAMCEVGLAKRTRGEQIRISGAEDRIAYLLSRQQSGRHGGLKAAESKRSVVKQTLDACSSNADSKAQATGNPLVPDPSPDPVPVPDEVPDQEDSAASRLAGLKSKVDRKFKKPTEAELASVRVVLDKLSEFNTVRYTCSDEHTRLIVNQLRKGVTEAELRMIVWNYGYKWGKDSKEFEEMGEYLRPETLFGPKTIAKYLDPSRSAYQRWKAEREAKPREAPSDLVRDLVARGTEGGDK